MEIAELGPRRKVYVQGTGIKFGLKGAKLSPVTALASLSKKDRRKVRKALHAKGFGGLAHKSIHG